MTEPGTATVGQALLARYRPAGAWHWAIGACQLLATLAMLGQAAVLAGLLSMLAQPSPHDGWLPWVLAAFVALLMLRALLDALARWLASRAALAVTARLRRALLEAVTALPESRRQGRPLGEWTLLLTRSVDEIGGWYALYQPQKSRVALVALLVPLAVAVINPLAALLLWLCLPLLPLFMILVGSRAAQAAEAQQQALSHMGGFFNDRLRALLTLRLFNAEARAASEMAAASESYRARAMAVLRMAFLSSAVLELFASMSIALLAVFVGLGLLGYIDVGGAAALTLFGGLFILLLVPEFFLPLRQLGQHYHVRADALAAAARIAPWLEAPTVPAPVHGPTEQGQLLSAPALSCPASAGGLQCYPALSIRQGEKLCIAGPSGIGKSHWLAMLAGLEPADAVILRREGLRWLRIEQSPPLMPGRLADVLRLAAPDLDVAAMPALLERVGLPLDPDTLLGPEGFGLSGGERQRLLLAQAIAHRAELWLLDEPTAALDAGAERNMLDLLDRLREEEGVSLVVASHSPRVRAWASRVIDLGSAHD